MTGAARRWLDALLHLHDSPRRTAAAFALGVFFGFSPFLGLQILLSFGLAFLFRLNRAAVFLGLNTNLPWFMAPWYTATTIGAAWLLGVELPADLGARVTEVVWRGPFDAEFWRGGAALVRPLLAPFLVGPTVAAAAVGAASYPIAHLAIERRRRTRAPQTPAAPSGRDAGADVDLRSH